MLKCKRLHFIKQLKIFFKGFERILGAAANPEPQLIEVTAGQAKYEHAYHSIVWRIPKLPKEGQGLFWN